MKFKLQFKVIGFVILLSIIAFLILGLIYILDYKESLTDSYISEAETVAFTLDANIRSAEDLKDKSILMTNIQKNIWLNPNILSISINMPENDELKVFVSNNQQAAQTPIDYDNYNSYETNSLISKFIANDNINVLRVITPVHLSGQKVGTYQIDFTMEYLEQEIKDKIIVLIGILLIVLLLFALALFFVLGHILINPILKINEGLNLMRQNNLNYKLNVKSRDEIGELANSFDELGENLSKSRKELEKSNQTLESKVKERTKELETKNEELERFNKMVVDRELKMIELKTKIKQLEEENKKLNK